MAAVAGARAAAPEVDQFSMNIMDMPGEPFDPSQMITQLREQHSGLERRLTELHGRLFLTPSEEIEVRRIKRAKLVAKDRIQHLSRRSGASG